MRPNAEDAGNIIRLPGSIIPRQASEWVSTAVYLRDHSTTQHGQSTQSQVQSPSQSHVQSGFNSGSLIWSWSPLTTPAPSSPPVHCAATVNALPARRTAPSAIVIHTLPNIFRSFFCPDMLLANSLSNSFLMSSLPWCLPAEGAVSDLTASPTVSLRALLFSRFQSPR